MCVLILCLHEYDYVCINVCVYIFIYAYECLCMHARMCVWVCMNVYGCLELVGGINVQKAEGPSIPLGSVRGSYISTPTSLIIL